MYTESLKQYFRKMGDLSPDELETAAQFYQVQKMDRGSYFLRKGAVCHAEGYVVEGCFKVSVSDAKGSEKVLYFAAQDWWVMELDSFAHQSPSSLDIQALTDSTLLTISYADKELLYRAVPKMERLFRLMYQRAVAAWQKRLIRNHTMQAEERYDHFITTYPEITERVTNKLIASYLGITQEFLSMIRKRRAERKE